jgi:hypothetical protein
VERRSQDSRNLIAAMTRRLSLSDGARPSLAKMLAICFSTTPAAMTRFSAIAALDLPQAISGRIPVPLR